MIIINDPILNMGILKYDNNNNVNNIIILYSISIIIQTIVFLCIGIAHLLGVAPLSHARRFHLMR